MKKKRKKNTSLYCPLLYQLYPIAVVSLDHAPSSAPDVPSRCELDSDLRSCYEFAGLLFGKEVCQWQTHGSISLRTFLRQISEKTFVKWDTVQLGNRLYVHVPLELSRDSFVALLDYAEEELDVNEAIVCLDRGSSCFSDLVKSFRFMGFDHVAPEHPSIAFRRNLDENKDTSFPKGLHFLGYEFD